MTVYLHLPDTHAIQISTAAEVKRYPDRFRNVKRWPWGANKPGPACTHDRTRGGNGEPRIWNRGICTPVSPNRTNSWCCRHTGTHAIGPELVAAGSRRAGCRHAARSSCRSPAPRRGHGLTLGCPRARHLWRRPLHGPGLQPSTANQHARPGVITS